MHRYRFLLCFSALLALGSQTRSASLDEARRLHREGSVQAALAEIEEILGADLPRAEKAEALDLLGDIAVDQGYLAMAKQAWSRLVADYPEFIESTDARTKLSLVSAVLGAESEEPGGGRPVASEPGASPTPPEVIEEPRAKPEKASPVVEPMDTNTASAATQTHRGSIPKSAATAPSTDVVDGSGLVLVAVRGKPHDAAQEASDKMVEFLRQRGVDATSATGGIPVVQESDLVLPLLFEKGQEKGASSVLLLTTEFVNMQRMALECYLPNGSELWKVKVSGGTGTTGREWTKTGINYKLVDRFERKLEPRIGGPGLPVTLQ